MKILRPKKQILAFTILSLLTLAHPAIAGVKLGDIDSSGGDLVRSTEEDFQEAFGRSLKNLSEGYHRLSYIYNSPAYQYDNDDATLPLNRLQGIVSLTRETRDEGYGVDYYQSRALDNAFAPANRARAQYLIQNLKFRFQNTDCESNLGHRDASVTPQGEVCLNKASILRLPVEVLEKQLTALLAHEVGHLLGLGEDDAVRVQKSLLTWPSVAAFDSEQSTKFSWALSQLADYAGSAAVDFSNWIKDPASQTLASMCDRADSWDHYNERMTLATQDDVDVEASRNERIWTSNINFAAWNNFHGAHTARDELLRYCGDSSPSSIEKQKPEALKRAQALVDSLLEQQEIFARLSRDSAAANFLQPPTINLVERTAYSRLVTESIRDGSQVAKVENNVLDLVECRASEGGQELKIERVAPEFDAVEERAYEISSPNWPKNTQFHLGVHQTSERTENRNLPRRMYPQVYVGAKFLRTGELSSRAPLILSASVNAGASEKSGLASYLQLGKVNGFSVTAGAKDDDSGFTVKNLNVECHFIGTTAPTQSDSRYYPQ